jgi:phage gp45-like
MSAEDREAAMQTFRGHKLTQQEGRITGVGHEGQPLADIPACQPYGIRSAPPQDHELVYLQTEGGLVVVTTREDAADYSGYGLSEPEDSEVVLYNSQGASVRLNEDGDIVAEPKSGRHVKLGSGATEFVAMANLVKARVDTIQQAFDGHQHAETGGTTSTPIAPIGALAGVAATKAKVE